MKIISKFQDYYDIGLAYGVDEKLRFERKSSTLQSCIQTSDVKIIRYEKSSVHYRIILYFELIGFCGVFYPYVRAALHRQYRKNKKTFSILEEENMFYEIESLNDFFVLHYKALGDIKYIKSHYAYRWRDEFLKDKIAKFFKKSYNNHRNLFEQYKIPYFNITQTFEKDKWGYTRTKYSCTLLPVLKKYKFAKAVPPMQAFQEISMFLGQLDLAEDNTVTIEDKYLAQGKGFDCYSFKKMPSKRKVKSC